MLKGRQRSKRERHELMTWRQHTQAANAKLQSDLTRVFCPTVIGLVFCWSDCYWISALKTHIGSMNP